MTSVLFLCTHNSARSQMAEGLLRQLSHGSFEAASAGTEPGHLHPDAVQAMSEAGIDITSQYSKGVEAFDSRAFDYVITVCDQARETCPVLPGTRQQLHWSLPDPAAAAGGEAEKLDAFRAVRDSLTSLISEFILGATK